VQQPRLSLVAGFHHLASSTAVAELLDFPTHARPPEPTTSVLSRSLWPQVAQGIMGVIDHYLGQTTFTFES
jgi:hypothetical protein